MMKQKSDIKQTVMDTYGRRMGKIPGDLTTFGLRR
jgi:hypothetical protein